MTEKRRRSRSQVASAEEPTQFYCPVAAQAESFEERLSDVEASVSKFAELEDRVLEFDEDLADEAHEARKREDQLQAQADAMAARLAALELQTGEVEALRRKIADLEQEVLSVAERALAATTPTDITEGACVWDRVDGGPFIALAQTIVDVRETAEEGGRRGHRVLGWVVRDGAGGYRARPAAELSTVRPRVVGQPGNGALRMVLALVATAAITMLLKLAFARS